MIISPLSAGTFVFPTTAFESEGTNHDVAKKIEPLKPNPGRPFVLCLAGWAVAPACPGGAESHQFDFWIGEWNVTANGNQAGTNSIRRLLDGCVIHENWVGASGSKGTSFNFYNTTSNKWQQFWVWKNGTVLELAGGLQDGKMVMQGESATPQGGKRLNRITWSKNPDGSVRQHWEASNDQGKTWTTLFDGLYKKKP